jgi:small subunit ribosomal protein S21
MYYIMENGEGGVQSLVTIKVDDYDSFSQALKRFKVRCQQSGLTSEIKRHREYEKPAERKRKKRLRAIRRQRRRMLKFQTKRIGVY